MSEPPAEPGEHDDELVLDPVDAAFADELLKAFAEAMGNYTEDRVEAAITGFRWDAGLTHGNRLGVAAGHQ